MSQAVFTKPIVHGTMSVVMFRTSFQLSLYKPTGYIFDRAFNLKVSGYENLKNFSGSHVVVANHASYFDFLLVAYVLASNSKVLPIRFAAHYSYYYMFWPIMIIGGAFPIFRKIGIEKTLKKGIEVLELDNGSVIIFPEGKMRKRGRPRKARRGAAFLALKTGKPILPMKISGNFGLTLRDLFRTTAQVHVSVGKPYFLAASKYDISDKNSLSQASEVVMQSIKKIKVKNEK